MSGLLTRILLSVLLLPMAGLLYTIVWVVAYEYASYPIRGRTAWVAAGIVAWLFLAGSWLLLWGKAIHWTTARKRWTLLAAAGAAIAGGAIGFLLRTIDPDFGFFVFSSLSPLIWLALTILICTDERSKHQTRSAETDATLLCPECGYDLRGLRGTTCPECGTSYTLDELIAAQPGRELRELNP